eukprot:CAMPEP_0194153660 /NCGR_PEP_ID=MMETSP0152-20130528/57252_1 /TAXON_ID=1049557 /ORGANISM="Thalassiothrix antarctica, Strain L6-D1" /LENGTH=764 /DNA_ID=CAMNT_0038859097 /DNA_START=29 /DNA_END=2319 /DNA_ORIENTATION=+
MAVPWILDSSTPEWPKHECGAKASNLSVLRQKGFLVPKGFALTNSGTEILLERNTSSSSRSSSSTIDIDDLLQETIQSLAEQCGRTKNTSPTRFAVRSSCALEDGGHASCAGMFETLLNVPPEKTLEAIYKVAAKSQTSLAGALELYSESNNDNDGDDSGENSSGVAVLVQEMIDCWYSGVAFSKCPLTGKNIVTIEAVEGLCDGLTAGEVTLERYMWDMGESGKKNQDQPLWVSEVATEILALAKVFGQPVDCEWAITKTGATEKFFAVVILQVRPITAIGGSSSNIIETEVEHVFHFWHGGIAPLWSRELAARSYLQYGFGGIPQPHLIKDAYLFVKAGSLDMKGYLSNTDHLQAKHVARDIAACDDGLRKILETAKAVAAQQREFYAIYSSIDATKLDNKELWCHFWDMCLHFLKNYQYYIFSESFLADPLTDELLGEATIDEGIILQPTKADLFQVAASSFRELFRQNADVTDRDILDHAKRFPFVAYNCFSESQVIENLRDAAHSLPPHTEGGEFHDQFENLLEKQEVVYSKRPDLRIPSKLVQDLSLSRMSIKNGWTGSHFYLIPVFEEIVSRTNVNLEDLNGYYLLGDIHDLLLSGKIVSNRDKLDREKGVLFRPPSITTTAVRLEAPKEVDLGFSSEGSPHLYVGANAQKLFSAMPQVKYTGLQGTVASPGTVTGRARIIGTNDGNKYKIDESQDILVCYMAQPQQYSMIQKCKGIVTEEGGILSHAAIVARELGITCVVGVQGAMATIKDGSTIT